MLHLVSPTDRVYQDTTATVTTVFHTASGNVTVVRSLGPQPWQ